jgi:hypothetical protein
MGCVEDVRAGKAVGMFLEGATVKYMLLSNADLRQSMIAVPGKDRMRLAPTFGNTARGREIFTLYVHDIYSRILEENVEEEIDANHIQTHI